MVAEVRWSGILDYFENLEDPRIELCEPHSLLNITITTIAICAVIWGTTCSPQPEKNPGGQKEMANGGNSLCGCSR